MKLFTSYWGNKDTFKMMPVTDECPFLEVIYDPKLTLLVVISKQRHQKYQMMERLDENGNPIMAKKTKDNGKPWQEQRILMEVLQEYYLTNKEEQEEFIKEFAINADTFDYAKFLRDMEKEPLFHIPEQLGLVKEDGTPLKSSKEKIK